MKTADSDSCPNQPRKLQENRLGFAWEFQLLIQTQNLPSCPLQILKLAWPPLLKICKASLNILYEGACRVGLEIQLNSCLFSQKKKKIKTSPNQTKMGKHTEYLNTAACHISPEGGKSSPIPLPQATPIKHTIIFSLPIAVILSCTDERVGL